MSKRISRSASTNAANVAIVNKEEIFSGSKFTLPYQWNILFSLMWMFLFQHGIIVIQQIHLCVPQQQISPCLLCSKDPRLLHDNLDHSNHFWNRYNHLRSLLLRRKTRLLYNQYKSVSFQGLRNNHNGSFANRLDTPLLHSHIP